MLGKSSTCISDHLSKTYGEDDPTSPAATPVFYVIYRRVIRVTRWTKWEWSTTPGECAFISLRTSRRLLVVIEVGWLWYSSVAKAVVTCEIKKKFLQKIVF